MPFETNNVRTTYGRIQKCLYSFPEYVAVPEEAKDLIEKILIREPANRISLVNIKAHNFITKDYSIIFQKKEIPRESYQNYEPIDLSTPRQQILPTEIDTRQDTERTLTRQDTVINDYPIPKHSLGAEIENLQNRLQNLKNNAKINYITQKYMNT